MLLLAMPVTILSGLAMARQFAIPWFNYDLAISLHTQLAAIVIALILYTHSLAGILIVFQRHPKWNRNLFKIPVGILWTILFMSFGLLFLAQPPSATKVAQDAPQKSDAEKITSPVAKTSETTNQAETLDTRTTATAFDAAEISRHSDLADCWLLIDGKVYDVTPYIEAHPGGAETIDPTCGTDATEAYNTKNKGIPHSADALEQLKNYYIGDLKK